MPATLSPDDLKSAVEAGVIDAAQAEKLKAMSAAPNASAPAYADAPLADEEHFRFLNGFNDVFLTIGVLLIAAAAFATGFLMLAAVIFWVLSEILVRRLRAVLPGIVLSSLFVATTAITFQYYWYGIRTHWDISSAFAFWTNLTLNLSLPALVASRNLLPALSTTVRTRTNRVLGLHRCDRYSRTCLRNEPLSHCVSLRTCCAYRCAFLRRGRSETRDAAI